MEFEDEYDPWYLFGTDDPFIDDVSTQLAEEEIQQYADEWESWC